MCFLVLQYEVWMFKTFIIWKGLWPFGLTRVKVGLWTGAFKKSIYFDKEKLHFLILADLDIICLDLKKFEFKCYK